MILSGNRQGMMGMFGGGRGGAARDPDAFDERPGESWATGSRGGGGFTPEMRVLAQAARDITGSGRFGGGRGGGNQPPMAGGGEYTVILRVAGQEYRQPLTVIQGADAGEGGGFFEEF